MQGLDSLAARCAEYKAAGCEFAKWRSPLEIDVAAGQPSDLVIEANMRDLARYALICQAEGLVPIVEPDIALKGDHDLETAVRVNVKVQSELFKAMLDHGVYMAWANAICPSLSHYFYDFTQLDSKLPPLYVAWTWRDLLFAQTAVWPCFLPRGGGDSEVQHSEPGEGLQDAVHGG
jgi:hypothetical protein